MPKIRFEPLVYFVQAVTGGPIKIGRSDIVHMKQRLIGIQTGNPTELRVLACIAGDERTERELHAALAEHRIRGEWFEDNAIVRNTMEQLVREHGIEALL